MKNSLIFYVFVCVSCIGQNKDKEKLIGEWIEISHIRYDRQGWMKEDDSPKEHYFFFVNSRYEDHTYESDVQSSFYMLNGKDLTIGNMKYKIDSLTENSFILYTFKEILDTQNDNPYSRKYYFNRVKK